ncbi:unnamed protein product [Nesidiocoris tenuis]|uniref:Uncharacterized protein n=1 Tax=Nesidiocoris tenuis TaxID=355587 RepID=A0A6H5GB36_9HEMI|nr:unnamed protein product [Nesidiocoris tenuis]
MKINRLENLNKLTGSGTADFSETSSVVSPSSEFRVSSEFCHWDTAIFSILQQQQLPAAIEKIRRSGCAHLRA